MYDYDVVWWCCVDVWFGFGVLWFVGVYGELGCVVGSD